MSKNDDYVIEERDDDSFSIGIPRAHLLFLFGHDSADEEGQWARSFSKGSKWIVATFLVRTLNDITATQQHDCLYKNQWKPLM